MRKSDLELMTTHGTEACTGEGIRGNHLVPCSGRLSGEMGSSVTDRVRLLLVTARSAISYERQRNTITKGTSACLLLGSWALDRSTPARQYGRASTRGKGYKTHSLGKEGGMYRCPLPCIDVETKAQVLDGRTLRVINKSAVEHGLGSGPC